MKLIACSQRIDAIPERSEFRDALDQRLIKFFESAGLFVVPVPNALTDTNGIMEWLDKVDPEGVCLSGGNDLDSVPKRDQTERGLVEFAYMRKLPLLGICRGMHFLGSVSGVGIQPVRGHVGRHDIWTNDGKFYASVASYHNYALKECPKEYTTFAKSADSIIEIIQHRTLSWEGWQFHPERESKLNPLWIHRVTRIFK